MVVVQGEEGGHELATPVGEVELPLLSKAFEDRPKKRGRVAHDVLLPRPVAMQGEKVIFFGYREVAQQCRGDGELTFLLCMRHVVAGFLGKAREDRFRITLDVDQGGSAMGKGFHAQARQLRVQRRMYPWLHIGRQGVVGTPEMADILPVELTWALEFGDREGTEWAGKEDTPIMVFGLPADFPQDGSVHGGLMEVAASPEAGDDRSFTWHGASIGQARGKCKALFLAGFRFGGWFGGRRAQAQFLFGEDEEVEDI